MTNYPAGTVVHAVQELGGTFVFLDKSAADTFYDGEEGAVDLCRGAYTLRADHDSLDSAADEATTYFEPDYQDFPQIETHRLVGWGDFEDLHDQIRSRLFGHLARLAAPVVVEYHSDLYRDAQWIAENVTGPCEMDFVVRYHGTFLGMVGAEWNMARTHIQSTSGHGETDRFYYLSLTMTDKREWLLTIRRNR